jgi:hypothetical protein
MTMPDEPFVKIRGLRKTFRTRDGDVEVLKGIDLDVGSRDFQVRGGLPQWERHEGLRVALFRDPGGIG